MCTGGTNSSTDWLLPELGLSTCVQAVPSRVIDSPTSRNSGDWRLDRFVCGGTNGSRRASALGWEGLGDPFAGRPLDPRPPFSL